VGTAAPPLPDDQPPDRREREYLVLAECCSRKTTPARRLQLGKLGAANRTQAVTEHATSA
jgi:hypothetical protein